MTDHDTSRDLRSLAKRALTASDDDRLLEGEIFHALHGHEGEWSDDFADGVWHRRDPTDAMAFDGPPAYLVDLNAAASIVRKTEMVSRLDQGRPDGDWACFVVKPGSGGGMGQHRKAVRALLAAALDARAANP